MGKRDKPGIILCKTRSGVMPASPFDAEELDRFAPGAEFDLVPRARRSSKLQRTYWLALSRVVKATGAKPTAEKLHDALLWDLGYVSVETDFAGIPRLVRDSTAYDAMRTDAEFRPYFDQAMARLAELVGFDPLEFLEHPRPATPATANERVAA